MSSVESLLWCVMLTNRSKECSSTVKNGEGERGAVGSNSEVWLVGVQCVVCDVSQPQQDSFLSGTFECSERIYRIHHFSHMSRPVVYKPWMAIRSQEFLLMIKSHKRAPAQIYHRFVQLRWVWWMRVEKHEQTSENSREVWDKNMLMFLHEAQWLRSKNLSHWRCQMTKILCYLIPALDSRSNRHTTATLLISRVPNSCLVSIYALCITNHIGVVGEVLGRNTAII